MNKMSIAKITIIAHDLHNEMVVGLGPTTPWDERICKICDIKEVKENHLFVLTRLTFNNITHSFTYFYDVLFFKTSLLTKIVSTLVLFFSKKYLTGMLTHIHG